MKRIVILLAVLAIYAFMPRPSVHLPAHRPTTVTVRAGSYEADFNGCLASGKPHDYCVDKAADDVAAGKVSLPADDCLALASIDGFAPEVCEPLEATPTFHIATVK